MTIAKTIFVAAAFAVSMAAPSFAADWIEKTSPHSVEKTSAQLQAAIEKSPASVFSVIDHQANAKKAGLDLEPTVVILFGNPKIGTPIMMADRNAAIELPVHVLIYEKDGKTHLRALSPEGLKARYNLDAAADALKNMGGAIEKLTDAAIK